MHRFLKRNQSGVSLVAVMVFMGVTTVSMMAMLAYLRINQLRVQAERTSRTASHLSTLLDRYLSGPTAIETLNVSKNASSNAFVAACLDWGASPSGATDCPASPVPVPVTLFAPTANLGDSTTQPIAAPSSAPVRYSGAGLNCSTGQSVLASPTPGCPIQVSSWIVGDCAPSAAPCAKWSRVSLYYRIEQNANASPTPAPGEGFIPGRFLTREMTQPSEIIVP